MASDDRSDSLTPDPLSWDRDGEGEAKSGVPRLAHGRIPVGHRETVRTWANFVTAFRTVVGLALFAVAAVQRDATLNYAGLAVYWVLDIVDGFVARKLNQETRIGAQFDILSDRLLVSFFYLNYLAMNPSVAPTVALFLLQFAIIDQYLSNQFLRWPILSPNYFNLVDDLIWKLNWSVPGKMFNTGLVTILLIVLPTQIPALVISVVLIVLKLFCCARAVRLPAPERTW
jgi:CDP-diacylglycerol---glycerol-3-phosphate 3-phosphatidyltransferase